ncbi:dihydrolipoyl dehydrogenase family protein [Oceanicella actignis]|uniref:dihydrolipoyl dehydrogenase family protein n=1 Tax=Oceanicella actignis TaxID=1189325 RepID=UPI0011E6DC71|nr:FAD-dependent oxidoreductase [Oceanicella actignis]TYO90833.1 pyruvate/2-oxoglutarate dehydrogenase complex dihydrolipoamide dehydrogenase (E3) component [Oceanicella actignis]
MKDAGSGPAPLRPDLCVIGAGAAGLSVAAGAAQMGASVVLVEGAEMGGDCLNHGCVPSKALLAAARRAHAHAGAARFGLRMDPPRVDHAAVLAHVREVIAAIAPHDSQERFEGLGVTVIRDWARFVSPRAVEAGGRRIEARRFVIATGSSPAVPPIPGLDETPFETNETIFALDRAPERLIVIGAGPIGLEMAQAHRRLGAEVTVLEAGRALARDDPEAAAVVLAALRAEGVVIEEGVAAARVRREGAGVAVETSDGRAIGGTHLLVAAGRAPNVGRLNLAAAGVAHDARGVKVDRGLRTSNRRVYALGDVNGGPQFTHEAGRQAGLALRSALFRLPVRADRAAIPWVTYTEPELAQIGPTEAEARAAHGARLSVLRADFAANDRARAERAAEGFVKVMAVRGRPIGVTIVGPHAGELIGLWALAISARLKLSAVAGLTLPYPTLNDASRQAAAAHYAARLFGNPWIGRAVRLLARLG